MPLYLPLAFSNWLPTSNLNVSDNEYNKLYAASRKFGSSLPIFSRDMFRRRPGTSFGRIARSFMLPGWDASNRFLLYRSSCMYVYTLAHLRARKQNFKSFIITAKIASRLDALKTIDCFPWWHFMLKSPPLPCFEANGVISSISEIWYTSFKTVCKLK